MTLQFGILRRLSAGMFRRIVAASFVIVVSLAVVWFVASYMLHIAYPSFFEFPLSSLVNSLSSGSLCPPIRPHPHTNACPIGTRKCSLCYPYAYCKPLYCPSAYCETTKPEECSSIPIF